MKKTDKITDLENKWKRALADYANLEKRIEKEKEDFVKFANAQLLDKILNVLDDLESAEKHLKDKGLTLAGNRFREIFKEEGVEEIEVLGRNFDPELMDAVETVDGPKNKVVEVVLKGYKLYGKVLRPAKVKVGGNKKL
ncbi:nucleotide exchange factor GrpE [Candidatus Shapirobacteria bacterium CG_4_9_14_0_2_um_filter_39_11]|uniref:Protein GrpE n=1 Tax=Candidatus Shapirobacteria bacterium CG_4_9_14_0_2_um_filter_39_11 TaxID=1974478 RepID=A0A2M8ESA6_9BACT|nr:MAG: nucleotide exchange factor GrpE [Candidatus Shapirobacteria bacterium CG_4_9_14_0_2_um_filter_39_11]